MSSSSRHWDEVWSGRDPAAASWYQIDPARSLELVASSGVGLDEAIIDVGGGTSALVVRLARLGHRDLTVLDIARPALDLLDRALVGELGAHAVHLVHADVVEWRPERTYALWHDRAVNHFLTDPVQRQQYGALAANTIAPGGHLVLGAFATDGPAVCSGLPVHRSDPAALAAELGPAFALLSVTRELHETPWHATQSFQYLLLRRR